MAKRFRISTDFTEPKFFIYTIIYQLKMNKARTRPMTSKSLKSVGYFQNTKIESCQYIVNTPGGARAVAFPLKATGWKIQDKAIKAAEPMSHTGHTFKIDRKPHCTMAKKPLVPYNPNSFRSRLSTPDTFVRYRNASSIVIGDRSQSVSHFRTTYGNQMIGHDLKDMTTNHQTISTKNIINKSKHFM